MTRIRQQLTLFIDQPNGIIEKVRQYYNPLQFKLISAHITLCREDEIEQIDLVIDRIKTISLKEPVCVEFGAVKRFENGKGVLLPGVGDQNAFRELRKSVLGQIELSKEQFPHITLLHPRNATCTDEIFEKIKEQVFPTEFFFDTISWIEQRDGGKWNVLDEFSIVNNTFIQE
jgi:2'-5' RNA ligase